MQISHNSPALSPPAQRSPNSEASPQAAARDQLAATSRPQRSLLLPELQTRTTVDSITQRFEGRYQAQVEKGRHVDIRV